MQCCLLSSNEWTCNHFWLPRGNRHQYYFYPTMLSLFTRILSSLKRLTPRLYLHHFNYNHLFLKRWQNPSYYYHNIFTRVHLITDSKAFSLTTAFQPLAHHRETLYRQVSSFLLVAIEVQLIVLIGGGPLKGNVAYSASLRKWWKRWPWWKQHWIIWKKFVTLHLLKWKI